MAFDSLGRYTATHKTWDHVGNILPDLEHSEGIRPHGEFKPAPWLPVQFWDKHYENWFVVLPGKLVAADVDGWLVPAQYGVGDPNIVYTADDVAAGVIDVRTGSALTAAATFAVSTVTNYMGKGYTLTVGWPLGVAPYAYLQWAGDGGAGDDGFNPANYTKHNYNMQHRTALLCDYVLELPLVPAVATVEGVTQASNTANVSTMTALTYGPVAANTVRTPMTWAEGVGAPGDVATKFAVEKNTAAEVRSPGDWHIDLTTKVVTVYSTGAIGATDYTLVYYHYQSAPATVSKFACAVGNLKPGDFVKCDTNSNFAVAVPKVYGTANGNNFDTFSAIMGQVLEIENVEGKDALDKVRTAYSNIGTSATGSLPAYAGQMDQMPGTANGGVPAKVHYAGAANLVVRINLISR